MKLLQFLAKFKIYIWLWSGHLAAIVGVCVPCGDWGYFEFSNILLDFLWILTAWFGIFIIFGTITLDWIIIWLALPPDRFFLQKWNFFRMSEHAVSEQAQIHHLPQQERKAIESALSQSQRGVKMMKYWNFCGRRRQQRRWKMTKWRREGGKS